MPVSTPILPPPLQWPQLSANALVHAVAMARVAIVAHVRCGIEHVQRVIDLELVVGNVEGRQHLPIVELRPAD